MSKEARASRGEKNIGIHKFRYWHEQEENPTETLVNFS